MYKYIKEMMERRKKFIGLSEVERNNTILRSAYTLKKRGLNIALGSLLVGLGLVTLPLPSGSIVLLILGVGLFNCPFSISCLTASAYREFKIWWGFLW